MKRILNFFCVAILALTSLFAISACGGSNTKAADLLKTFVIEQDGKTVNADFTVPAEINVNDEKYKLTWTSNNNYVVIGNKSDASYIVNVTRPETAQEAKLTVSLKIDNGNKATKDFTVRVTPIDVYDFVDEFTEKVIFEQNGTSVTTDFDLVTSYSLANYPNETATISWESRNEELVRIEGNKAIVTPTDVETRVNLIATFSYKGETSKSTFSVKVASPMTDFERLQYWYNNEGITQTLSGYVVLIGNAYDEGYGNISLYMIDDTLQGGYYLYRVKTTVDEAAKITLGCHVTVTGTTNTNYSGLMETNAGGNLVVDTDVTPINVKDTVYAMDNDIIANAQSLYYRQSTLVSLSNWKVCDIGDPVAAGNNSTAMKVEKDGVKVTLRYSKYVQDTSTDEAVAEINAMISKFKVGDYVNVDGLLSYYDYDKEKYKQSAYQIYITGPDSVTAGSADTAPTPGKAVGSAISSFAGFAENYEEPKTISLPQDSNGVAISWSIPESCLSVTSSASITGNNLSITPVENKNELITIIGTFSKDGYETSVYYKFTTGKVAEQPGTPAEGELVTAPEAGVSYKLALVQENLNKDLYFAGAMSGFYYATTEDASAATDVILVETEGGFHLTMKDGTATKYLNVVREMGTDGKEHNNVKIEELASSVWTFNTEFNTLTTVLSDGKTYYLGTSNTHQTISASSIDKAPTSFVSHLYIGAIPEGEDPEQPETPEEGELVTAPKAGEAYKLALTQENLNKDLYFAGAMQGFYYATTEDASAATDVILVETEGGFHLTMKDGTATKYLNVVREMGTDGKEHNNVRIDDSAVSVWTFNTELNTLTTVLADGNTYYLGTYSNHSTISASTIDKAPTSFVSHLYTGAIPEETPEQPGTPDTPDNPSQEGKLVTAPKAGEAYKLALVQENLNKDLYFAGAMQGFYYATTEDASAATDVILVETEGGFHLTMKDGSATKYLNVVREMGTDGKEHNNVRIDDSAVSVWTFNTELNTLTTVLADGNTYYLGTYSNHSTISASTIDKAPTSFVSHLYTGSIPEETPEQPGTPDTPDNPSQDGEIITAPKAGEEYKLALIQGNLGKVLYITGSTSSNYLATTEDASLAAVVTLEEVSGGYHIKVVANGSTKYINLEEYTTSSGNPNAYLRLEDAPTAVWTFNTEYNTLTSELNGNTYYMGTYEAFQTFSASKISYASSSTNFISHLYKGAVAEVPEVPEVPDAPEVDGSLSATITFDDVANRISFSSSQQVWSKDGITVTNNQGASTVPVADYSNPARFYKNSDLTIEYTEEFTTVVVTCAGDPKYHIPASLQIDGATITVSGTIVTITFETPVDSFTINGLPNQFRVAQIDIYTA